MSLTATPERTFVNGVVGSYVVIVGTNRVILIGPMATTPGSLGAPVSDFVIFEGRGVERRFSVSTGLSWRF